MAETIFNNNDLATRGIALDVFNACGHVMLTDVYSPILAAAAAAEIDQLDAFSLRFKPGVGEQIANLDNLSRIDERCPHLMELLGAIGAGAGVIGREIAPARNSVLDVIRMESGVAGLEHTDRSGLQEAVGITTITSASVLLVEGEEYRLIPGRVAYLDVVKELPHQGIAAPEGERIGLALSRQRPKTKTSIHIITA